MRTLRFALFLACAVTVLAACVFAPTPPPISPLPAIRNSPLMGQWRVETVIGDGKTSDFRPYSPIYFTFTEHGTVDERDQCNSGWQAIYYQGDGRYQMGSGISTAAGCPEAVLLDGSKAPCAHFGVADDDSAACVEAQQQFNWLPANALAQTSRYQIDGDTLHLSGDGVSIHLVRDATIMPWQLVGPREVGQVTMNGEALDYAPFGPFYINFRRDGLVTVEDNCGVAAFTYKFDRAWNFTLGERRQPPENCFSHSPIFQEARRCIYLVGMNGTFAQCVEAYEELKESLVNALMATDRLESPGDGRGYLRGDGAEIVLLSMRQ